jgi:hypothetical protein
VLHGGGVEKIGEAFASGYYIQPTLLKGDTVSTVDIARPHARTEAVNRIVGNGNRFCFVFEGQPAGGRAGAARRRGGENR